MQVGDLSTTTKISRTFRIAGYVVDSDVVQRIDSIARQAVSGTQDHGPLRFSCWITANDNTMLRGDTLDAIGALVTDAPVDVRSLSLEYIATSAGINLTFESKGEIQLSAYSNAIDFQFNIDKLSREVQRCDPEYSWVTKAVFLNSRTKRLLAASLVAVSLFLIFHIWYYFYALQVGVNVDPSIIPSGNVYAQLVDRAIKSPRDVRKAGCPANGTTEELYQCARRSHGRGRQYRDWSERICRLHGGQRLVLCGLSPLSTIVFFLWSKREGITGDETKARNMDGGCDNRVRC